MDLQRLADLAKNSGLCSDLCQMHYRRFLRSRQPGFRHHIPIHDTCRLDNGGIQPQTWLAEPVANLRRGQSGIPSGVAAFIPAAGASSRYFRDLSGLRASLDQKDWQAVRDTLNVGDGAWRAWPLASPIRRLFEALIVGEQPSVDALTAALEAWQWPKGLQPCTAEGDSFFAIQHWQNSQFGGLAGEVYVVPVGLQGDFERAMQQWPPVLQDIGLPIAFMEQGADLSTFRIGADSEPIIEDGRLSLVPAGHGMLVYLLPQIAAQFPCAHSLLIRNVDNVAGNAPIVREATERFLWQYEFLRQSMVAIRQHLDDGSLTQAANIARSVLAESELCEATGSARTDWDVLWDLQVQVFSTTVHRLPAGDGDAALAELRRLYARPLNLLGQVPNIHNDVGGTPAFVETDRGREKVCLEVPHASAEDRERFLANPQKATHFNPVFVACEIPSDPQVYGSDDHEYWIIAEKEYLGKKVFYHETVLYELLGNSHFANAAFVEVPRAIFQPHKSVADGRGNTRVSLGLTSI